MYASSISVTAGINIILTRYQSSPNRSMFRRVSSSLIPIHKSKSCPVNFHENEASNSTSSLTIPTASPSSSSSSNGTTAILYSNSTTTLSQSDSRNSLSLSSSNNNVTADMIMTSPSHGISTSTTTSTTTNARKSGNVQHNNTSKSIIISPAIPGRPRRQGGQRRSLARPPKHKKDPSQSLRYRLLNAKWMKNINKEASSSSSSSYASLLVAVFLWYTLGVISITTSNLLMMNPQYNHESSSSTSMSTTSISQRHVGNVPPLYLTLQQLMIGTTMLRLLISIGFMGSRGVQPWPSASATAQAAARTRRKTLLFNNNNHQHHNHNQSLKLSSIISDFVSSNLVLAGICFAMGFLATNSGFLSSSAAFVETVKAAEPLTSAVVAVAWKIETLSSNEVTSLGSIVAGVLISTLAHGSSSSSASSSSSSAASVGFTNTLVQSLQSCVVVMAANLCFSFRGLYQKLFRATPEGSQGSIDDLNLQLRMQQIGVLLLVVPVIVLDLPGIFSSSWTMLREFGFIGSGILFRYIALSLVNGIAFTAYK